MTLPGGSAAKAATEYEALWTARTLTQLLDDEIVAVHLEPPHGEGIEFTVEKVDGSREHHQAKTRSDGRWTLPALEREGVIGAIFKRTSDGSAFVFVSSAPVIGELRDLTDFARKATTVTEFQALLDESHRDRFEEVRSKVLLGPEAAWEALARVRFRLGDEDMLREQVVARLAKLVEGDPQSIVARLVEYSLIATNRRLTPPAVWSELALTRRTWDADPNVRTSVDRLRGRYLADAAEEVIAGVQVERDEVPALAARLLDANGPRRVVISASAGTGKSVVLAQTVKTLDASGVLVLPFRLDQVDLAAQPEAFGHGLGLPGSPTAVVAALAAGAPAVLAIDQLDAVSQVSGRDPQFLACVETILREARAFANVRVLLACRDFDLEADPRLRTLRGLDGTDVVEIGGFTSPQVDELLSALGMRRDLLTERQQGLLETPLHLHLLAAAPGSQFTTVLDLYERAWTSKRRALGTRAPHWTEIIDALCAAIDARRALAVPREVLDSWASEVDAMLSEHVLVETADGKVRFFHEGFFDFAFAKRFAGRGEPLVEYLLATDQDLFHRSQTRQILAYRRQADRDAYLQDVRAVLGSTAVRFHLKSLIVAWLRSIDDPQPDEWAILEGALTDPADSLTNHIVGLLRHPAWFDVADRAKVFERWLAAPSGSLVDRAVWVLGIAQRVRGARVAALLSNRPRGDERWRGRWRWLVQRADLAADEGFFSLVLDLVRDGTLDDLTTVFAQNGSFWDLGFQLKGKRPEWFIRLARAYLERRQGLAAAEGVTNPFEDHAWIPDPIDRDLFQEVATGAPVAFVGELLPFMMSVVRANRRWNQDEGRWDDTVWRWRWVGERYGIRDGLLGGMEAALVELARTKPELLTTYADLLESELSETADFLLLRAFAANPNVFADRATRFIVDKPARLHAGYTSDSYWAARDLVGAVFPVVGPALRSDLESAILGFYTVWERSKDGHHSHGLGQLTILSGITEETLSPSGRSRLRELRRKFGRDPEPPSAPEAGFVGPPIERPKARKMTDAQWLTAIAKYQTGRERRSRPIALSGGSLELARLLQEHVRADPSRFARLALQLPAATDWVYLEAVLRGLGEAEAAIDRSVAYDLLRRAHTVPGRPIGRAICSLIATLAESGSIPSDIVAVLQWYATEAPDPAPDGRDEDAHAATSADLAVGRDGSERFEPAGYAGMALLNRGLNSVRGEAAFSMAKVLRRQPQLFGQLMGTVRAIVRDRTRAVRACGMECLVAALPANREWTLATFLDSADDDAALAASPPGARLLRYALRSDADAASRVLEKLLKSQDPDARRVGAREACLAAFSSEAARVVAELALNGDRASRFGAAEVYAANLGDEAVGTLCEAPLRRLFRDADKDIRREAATCFRSLSGASVTDRIDILEDFASTDALTDDPHDLVAAILRTEGPLPDEAGEIGLQIVERAGVAAGDISTAWSAQMPDISAIAVRLNAFGSERGRLLGLDLFDRLSEVGAYGVDRALDSYERCPWP
jgi:hypothetical protein